MVNLNSIDYALNYAPNLPIMLKLCPLFLEGANLYVQIIIVLLCYVQHHNFSTNLKPGLGVYWDLPADYMDHTLAIM